MAVPVAVPVPEGAGAAAAPPRRAGDAATAVTAVAALLIAVQLVLRGWAASGGYFLLDDFVFVERAVLEPLDLEGLLTPYNGHVMPGAFLLVDALTALTPLSWPAVVGLLLVGQLAVDVALLRLLVALFGRRPAVLLPLAVYLTSSITLPAGLWLAAALNQLPQQLAVLAALLLHVRYLRSGRLRDAVGSAVAVAAGLLFSEKSVLALPLLVALTLLWFGEGGPVRRVVGALRRWRAAWLLHGGLVGGYLLVYALAVESPVVAAPTAADAAEVVATTVRSSVVPGLLGGPWRWEDFPPTLAITDPPVAAQVLAGVAALAVVAASLLLHRGAGRAWALLAAYVLGACLLLAASRVQVVGPAALSREYRYVTDVALVGALCLALAFLPVRDAPRVLRPRDGALAATLRRAARPALGAAVVAGLLAGSVVSTAGYAQRWWANPARPFVETARAELAGKAGIVLYDALVPDPVQWHVLGEHAFASRVLAAVPGPLFLADGGSSGGLAVLDGAGRVRPAEVPPAASAPPGPDAGCGWSVGDAPVRIPLDRATAPWQWVVHVAYLGTRDGTAWVTAGDQRVPVLVGAGLRDLYLQVTGSVSAVEIDLADGVGPVCVGGVEVGTPRVREGG